MQVAWLVDGKYDMDNRTVHSGKEVLDMLESETYLWTQALLMACDQGHAAVVGCLLSSEHSPLTVDEVQRVVAVAVTIAAEGGGSFHAAAQLLVHLQRRWRLWLQMQR